MGRHTEFTKEMGDRICELVSINKIGIERLCEKYPELPEFQTIYKWRNNNPDFDEQYVAAKGYNIKYVGEGLLDDATAPIPEKHYFYDEKGNKKVDPGYIQLKRLEIDTKKFIIAKLLPKIWGDRSQLTDEDKAMVPWIIKLQRGDKA